MAVQGGGVETSAQKVTVIGYDGSEAADTALRYAARRAVPGTKVVVAYVATAPSEFDGLTLPIQFRGTPIKVTVEGSELTVVALADGFSVPIRVGVGDDVRELRRGDSCTFTIGAPAGVA